MDKKRQDINLNKNSNFERMMSTGNIAIKKQKSQEKPNLNKAKKKKVQRIKRKDGF